MNTVPTHCTVDECQRGIVARGLCNAHYIKWKKYGDPTARTVVIYSDTVITGPYNERGEMRVSA